MNTACMTKKTSQLPITACEVWVECWEGLFRLLSRLSLARASPER